MQEDLSKLAPRGTTAVLANTCCARARADMGEDAADMKPLMLMLVVGAVAVKAAARPVNANAAMLAAVAREAARPLATRPPFGRD